MTDATPTGNTQEEQHDWQPARYIAERLRAVAALADFADDAKVIREGADEIELLRGYRDEAESEASIASLAVERLRLTDTERNAVMKATDGYIAWMDDNGELEKPDVQATLATLRGLLERLK